jgi:putative FmdB family regulatory protein
MPIYEFECRACGEVFDRLQKLSDPDPDACPVCGGGVRRRLTAPSFRLAGSGWYETDFKKDAEKKRNLADKAEPAKAEAKAEPKAESKPVSDSAKGKDTASKPTPKPVAEKPAKSSPSQEK